MAVVKQHVTNEWLTFIRLPQQELIVPQRGICQHHETSLMLRATFWPHCWQWETLLRLWEQNLVTWTTPEITTATHLGWKAAFIPHSLNGFRSKESIKEAKKAKKHKKGPLASFSKPKAKHPQVCEAIPALCTAEEQQDAHRRAPTFHGWVWAPGRYSSCWHNSHTCHRSAAPHAYTGLSELHLHSVSERSYLDFSKLSVLCWEGRAASLLTHPSAPCWLCVSMTATKQFLARGPFQQCSVEVLV